VLWSQKRSTFGVLDALAVNPQTAARLRAYLDAAAHIAASTGHWTSRRPPDTVTRARPKLCAQRGYNPEGGDLRFKPLPRRDATPKRTDYRVMRGPRSVIIDTVCQARAAEDIMRENKYLSLR